MLISPEHLAPGALISSRYEVLGLLGAGGMGWVLRVKDRLLSGHDMALKLVYPHLVSKENSSARFRSEVSITRRLSHPAIVQTFGFGRTENGLPYFVMEYVPGKTLKACASMPGGRMPFAETERILAYIAEGLAFAHAKGVIHRDLKPENILVRNDGLVKITDFGLAQMFREESRLTKAGTVLGTAFYMPPEQFSSQPLTRRSDIYSLGIMAYELAAGAPPFQGATLYELAEQHISAPLPPLSGADVPSWYSGFVVRCTEKDPEKRFSSMEEVLSFFHQCTSAGARITLSAAAESLPEPEREHSSFSRFLRNLGWRGFAVFAVIAALLVIILAANTSGNFQRRVDTAFRRIEKAIGVDLTALKRPFGLKTPGYNKTTLSAVLTPKSYDFAGAVDLIKLGKDPNAVDGQGNNAIHIWLDTADAQRHSHRLKELVQLGVKPDTRNYSGLAPLHIALQKSQRKQAVVLLRAGANPNLRFPAEKGETLGVTPLAMALRTGQKSLFAMLLIHKANPDDLLPGSMTVLHWAAVQSDSDAVELLLQYHARPDIQDADGRTPLMLALLSKGDRRQRADTIRCLAPRSDLAVRDKTGKSAADLAQAIGDQDSAAMLERLARQEPGGPPANEGDADPPDRFAP